MRLEVDLVERRLNFRGENQWPYLAFGVALAIFGDRRLDTQFTFRLAGIAGAIKGEDQARAIGGRDLQSEAEWLVWNPDAGRHRNIDRPVIVQRQRP